MWFSRFLFIVMFVMMWVLMMSLCFCFGVWVSVMVWFGRCLWSVLVYDFIERFLVFLWRMMMFVLVMILVVCVVGVVVILIG